jgi:hypothetical protein
VVVTHALLFKDDLAFPAKDGPATLFILPARHMRAAFFEADAHSATPRRTALADIQQLLLALLIGSTVLVRLALGCLGAVCAVGVAARRALPESRAGARMSSSHHTPTVMGPIFPAVSHNRPFRGVLDDLTVAAAVFAAPTEVWILG